MQTKTPEYLYKFRSLAGNQSKYVEEIFRDRTLYFSKASDFNDPFDCYPTFDWNANQSDIDFYIDSLVKQTGPHSNRKIRRRQKAELSKGLERTQKESDFRQSSEDTMVKKLQEYNIFCLSSDCRHTLMWSHYADSHKGICLQFSSKPGSIFNKNCKPVSYSGERPVINLISGNVETAEMDMHYKKSDVWCYEKEWRAVTKPDSSQKNRFDESELVGVILGAKICSDNTKIVEKWAEAYPKELRLQKARISSKTFDIEITDHV